MWSVLVSAVMLATMGSVATPPGVVDDQTFDGKVVSVAEKKLTVSDSAGQIMQSFTIPEGAKITLNGKAAGLMELMAGDVVTLTMDGQKIKTVAAMRSIKVN